MIAVDTSDFFYITNPYYAEKNKDIDTFTEIGKEFDYLNKRMDIVSKQMIGVRKLLAWFGHVIERI